jgi:hypothetical protein
MIQGGAPAGLIRRSEGENPIPSISRHDICVARLVAGRPGLSMVAECAVATGSKIPMD